MKKKIVAPEEALTLEKTLLALSNLELINECLDCNIKDTNDYFKGKRITFALDFKEIFPMLFPILAKEENYFAEMHKIWNVVFSLKQKSSKDDTHILDNIDFTLLPGTIFEFFHRISRQINILDRLDESRFKRLANYINVVQRMAPSVFEDYKNIITRQVFGDLLVFLNEQDIDKISIDPIKKMIGLYTDNKITLMEDVDEIRNAMLKVKINNPRDSIAYSTLSNARHDRKLSNLIDTYNILSSTGINLNLKDRDKTKLIIAASGYHTRVASKVHSTSQLGDDMLPMERHPLAISYLCNLLRNVDRADVADFLKESKLPLKNAINGLKKVKGIDLLLNMDRSKREQYVNKYRNKAIFLPKKVFDSITYLESNYIEKLQTPEQEVDKVLLDLLEIPDSKMFDSVLDWKKAKDKKEQIIIESSKFTREMTNFVGDNWQEFLPVNDPRIREVLDLFY